MEYIYYWKDFYVNLPKAFAFNTDKSLLLCS
jgi:hypothetical protein